MKILHIAPDEKFIDSAICQFELALPQKNLFIVFLFKNQVDANYVKSRSKNVLIKSYNSNEVSATLKIAEDYDLICFHSLNKFFTKIVLALPGEKKILWLLFGHEFYNNPLIINPKEILLERTYKETFNIRTIKGIKNYIIKCFPFIKKRPYLLIKKAMLRANYCGILYEEEYQLIKRKLKAIYLKHVKFCYYPLGSIIKADLKVSGDNILIGNSASNTNNHLDVFHILSKLDIGDRKLIVPLNYGDSKYRKSICKQGEALFGSNFNPLVDFLPLETYNSYISQCSTVIMGHIRQQAVGNVLTMLWVGAKIYLDERNTLYQYLNTIGANIYSIKDLSKKSAFIPLTEHQIAHNRMLLQSEISQEKLLEEMNVFINNFY